MSYSETQVIRFAAVNFMAEFGDVEKNLTRMDGWVQWLAGLGAEVVAFPEMSICGYGSSESIMPYFDTVPGVCEMALQEMAARFGVVILAGLARLDTSGKRYISQIAVSPDGLLALYDKIYLSHNEEQVFTPGDTAVLFPYKGWTIGLQLCDDTHFPEISAMQALEGADILFMAFASPHETPEDKYERFMRYLPARAYDNRCFLLNCNLTGTGAEGQSFTVRQSPWTLKENLLAVFMMGASITCWLILINLSWRGYVTNKKRISFHNKGKS